MIITSIGKHLKDISHAYLVFLMYKLKISANDTDDLSGGFDHDHVRRQRELTKI